MLKMRNMELYSRYVIEMIDFKGRGAKEYMTSCVIDHSIIKRIYK